MQLWASWLNCARAISLSLITEMLLKFLNHTQLFGILHPSQLQYLSIWQWGGHNSDEDREVPIQYSPWWTLLNIQHGLYPPDLLCNIRCFELDGFKMGSQGFSGWNLNKLTIFLHKTRCASRPGSDQICFTKLLKGPDVWIRSRQIRTTTGSTGLYWIDRIWQVKHVHVEFQSDEKVALQTAVLFIFVRDIYDRISYAQILVCVITFYYPCVGINCVLVSKELMEYFSKHSSIS